MEQVELGISPQELRFVISEADENENGVVDYEEFVPLAVDLIQAHKPYKPPSFYAVNVYLSPSYTVNVYSTLIPTP
jgi:hypothetical protein